MTIKNSFFRSLYVGQALLPFILSFIRDWHRYFLIGPPRPFTQAQHHLRAVAIKETMARLGPSFIKAAQVLAMREDLLAPTYTRELKKLQDQVPPFPYRQVAQIIRKTFGKPISELFEEFDQEPLAAASLGQVHQAVYKGQKVAVKVLRPGVEELVHTDVAVVRIFLNFLNIFIDENLMRSFIAISDEFERMIALEMDFRNERRNAARFRKNFRHIPQVYIPHFIEGMSNRHVALIEFVEGARVDRPEELAEVGVDPDDLVNLLIETYTRMAVLDGFIHADPHPGNLFVDKEKRLVILDYGMTLDFDDRTKLELLKLVYSVVKQDIDGIVDGFYALGMVDADINRGMMREAAQTLMEIQMTHEVTPRQVQEVAQDIIETFYRFPLRLPNNLVYLLRASTLIEGIAIQYNPTFNGIKAASPIVKRLLAEIAFKGKKPMKERALDVAKEAYTTVRDLGAVIHRLEREQLRVRLHEADLFKIERFLNAFLRRLLGGLGLIALGVMASMVFLTYPSPILLIVSLLILAILFFAVAFVPIARASQRKKPYFK